MSTRSFAVPITRNNPLGLEEYAEPEGESDPHGIASGEPGAKLDAGKAPIMQGVIQYFPRALREIALLSLYGAEKYAWKGWEEVLDGINRYGNAMGRHMLDAATDGMYDDGPGGSGALHDTAIAWNALAKLEMVLRELEEEGADKN